MSLDRCIRFVVLVLLLMTASGCSGIHPYRNDLAKNLTVRTKTASGSYFTSVKARVDIYAVDPSCGTTYRGSVALQRPEVEIGLPASGANYLNFVFASSSFLAGAHGATGFDRYFQTRPGHAYIAEASYVEGIYDVILKEKKPGSKQLRELDFGECKPKT
jgi:hypothetical protein